MNDLNIVKNILRKMFEISCQPVSFDEAIEKYPESWYREYTMTEDQCNEWKKWAVDYLRKKKHFSKIKSQKEIMWIDFSYGLKIKNKDA